MQKVVKFSIEAETLQIKKKVLQKTIHDTEGKIRMAINFLSKEKQSQSFCEHKSEFMKSAEWIVFIHKLVALLNVESKKKPTRAEMIDISSSEEVKKPTKMETMSGSKLLKTPAKTILQKQVAQKEVKMLHL